jgi:DNA polymerase
MNWEDLKRAVSSCTACSLHAARTQTVFGVGDERAEWLLVGEAPGAEEDRLGEPFVGQAGKLLDNMLAALGLKRGENVYIAAQALLASDASIASLRGRVHRYAGVPLVVTYHPAYLLRTLPDKAKAWSDLVFARRLMQDLQAGRAAPN